MDKKVWITLDNGTKTETAMHPVIVSASRATDIPAFYADWFFHRLSRGYSAWINPFNNKKGYVSYQDTRFIVFWSKNPKPLLRYFDELDKRGIGCYIQYTLNDYVKDGLEINVPPINERIDTFKRIVDRLGFKRVIWRFDPLILTDRISEEALLHKIEHIGDSLKGYTEKLVFSFADIACYRKVKHNLNEASVNYIEWNDSQMRHFAKQLVNINKKWNYVLATCGESIELPDILHNQCIDHNLIIQLSHQDKALMEYLGVTKIPVQQELFCVNSISPEAILLDDGTYAIKKKEMLDKGQRPVCGCGLSKDIGQYNTCLHQCEYCYATANKELAIDNWKKHQQNPWGELITGNSHTSIFPSPHHQNM